MPISVTIEGTIDTINPGIVRLAGPELFKAIQKSNVKAARIVARAAKANAKTAFTRRTGNTYRSIRVRSVRNRASARVFAGDALFAAQANLLEYGHRVVVGGIVYGFARPRPFLRPAIDSSANREAVSREFIQEFNRRIGELIRKIEGRDNG